MSTGLEEQETSLQPAKIGRSPGASLRKATVRAPGVAVALVRLSARIPPIGAAVPIVAAVGVVGRAITVVAAVRVVVAVVAVIRVVALVIGFVLATATIDSVAGRRADPRPDIGAG